MTHQGSLSTLSHKHLPAFVLQDELNGMFSDFLLILVHWLLVFFPIETLWKSQSQLLSLWWTHPGRHKESIMSWRDLVRNLEGSFQLCITVWETQRQELSWSVLWSSNGLSHLFLHHLLEEQVDCAEAVVQSEPLIEVLASQRTVMWDGVTEHPMLKGWAPSLPSHSTPPIRTPKSSGCWICNKMIQISKLQDICISQFLCLIIE